MRVLYGELLSRLGILAKLPGHFDNHSTRMGGEGVKGQAD